MPLPRFGSEQNSNKGRDPNVTRCDAATARLGIFLGYFYKNALYKFTVVTVIIITTAHKN